MWIDLTRRSFLSGALAACAAPALAAGQAYRLEPSGSRVAFIFVANGIQQTGTVPIATADITVDTANLTRSSATVTADIRKVRSNLGLVTQAIKSPELLHADAHPIVRFDSTRVRLGAQGRISDGAKIEGQLTLRGVTRDIVLDARLSRPAGSAPDDLSVLYISLKGDLSRRDYGASGYSALADDTVKLDIRAEIRVRA